MTVGGLPRDSYKKEEPRGQSSSAALHPDVRGERKIGVTSAPSSTAEPNTSEIKHRCCVAWIGAQRGEII
jgi:hypothetical protein